ncbi:hypothetical protein SAMN04487995_4377 [Dyadobacter koreensis]|uniref:Uncharacterized protein n=1 Tax=Dyadobacter koreensis TaxID=408657 RepID=A0A1H6YEJ6_9BACT|nr:hypothetical protein [Dyadobacter koreensis]SEJ38324.1 hypothetical protein SAMN04487995_4377 [Dyadobacter koreensis]
MKNKARFIFPRLIGATIIVGLAALIITTLFKLLLGMVFVAGAVMLVKRLLFESRQDASVPYEFHNVRSGISPLENRNGAGHATAVSPVFSKTTNIIPIN